MLIITVSVNYLDIFEYTYRLNQKILRDNYFYVISSEEDKHTQLFCLENNIQTHYTNIFYSNKSSFNKAGAINELIDKVYPQINDEWILLLDSDIVINNSVSEFNDLKDKNKQTLYGCKRKLFSNKTDYISNFGIVDNYPFLGFFQLFHKDIIVSRYKLNQKLLIETKNSAYYDKEFASRFKNRHLLNSITDHLGETSVNWEGRKSNLWK